MGEADPQYGHTAGTEPARRRMMKASSVCTEISVIRLAFTLVAPCLLSSGRGLACTANPVEMAVQLSSTPNEPDIGGNCG
jgi:hypothetical protein